MSLRDRVAVYEAVSEAATPVQNRTDLELRFGEPPAGLDGYALRKAEKSGLTLRAVPGFPVYTVEDMQRIVEARKRDPFFDDYPPEYLAGVAAGDLPVPHPKGYYELEDGPERRTPLSERLGVRSMHVASIKYVDQAVTLRGEEARAGSSLPENGYIRVITAKELFNGGAVKRRRRGATHTKERGTGRHVVYDGKEMTTVDPRTPGTRPNLAYVFGPPLSRTDYLPRRGNGKRG
jgi:hypothetical protein